CRGTTAELHDLHIQYDLGRSPGGHASHFAWMRRRRRWRRRWRKRPDHRLYLQRLRRGVRRRGRRGLAACLVCSNSPFRINHCPPNWCSLEGFAFQLKVLPDGSRQIMAFLIAGDFCDLRGLLMHQMDFGVAALGRTTVAVISHERLRGIIEKHPRLGLALWRDTMIDAAIYRQWLINVGRRSAYSRIAPPFC